MSQQKRGRLLYLSHAEVESVGLGMAEIVRAVEEAFRQKATGRTDAPPKIGVHPRPDGFIHAMPAYLKDTPAAGLKWVSAFPDNRGRGVPSISALIVTNDTETGHPLAVMDGRWITAKRTAAATALAARFLARPESDAVGILGCGIQARTHVEALNEGFQLKRVIAYDRHPERAAAFASEVRDRFGIDAAVADEPRKAVAEHGIVVTAGAITKQPHGTIQPGWLSAGAFASLVDFDSYWSADALSEIDKFCTDDTRQLALFREDGYFQHVPAVHADLGELVTGTKPGRESATERTVACNLGLAIEDVAVASLVYQRALDRGVGTWLDA
jgi:ornithine cyclodeaminase/alanine dehydrogenase-like protein (mu-crystallin family)